MTSTSRKYLLLGAALLVLAGSVGYTSYALTAANTVPATRSGSGSGPVTPFTITNIDYTFNETTPTNIDKVTFTISPSSRTAYIKLNATVYSCSNVSGSITCPTTAPQAVVVAAPTMKIIAAD